MSEIKSQNNNFKASLETNALNSITESHRNIFLQIAMSSKLSAYFVDDGDDVSDYSKKMLGSLLINHSSNVFLFYSKGMINNDEFQGMKNDIADLFTWPIISKRWQEIRSFYSLEFQEFIVNLSIHASIHNMKKNDT